MNPKYQEYQNQVEETYFNASNTDFAFDDDFAANDQTAGAYDPTQGMMYAAEGGEQAAVTIPDFNRTYSVTITNTVAAAAAVTIFGANQFANAVNFGSPATVTVAVGESTYQEMLA